MHHLYKENKLSIQPPMSFRIRPIKFLFLGLLFLDNVQRKQCCIWKMIWNIIVSRAFFISVKGSCINLIVAIISCPGVFSEQFMPPRGAKPQLESLMQISWLNVQPANMHFFFQCKACHLTKCSPSNIKKQIMKKGKLISWEVFSWLTHQIPPTNQPENV